MNSNQKKFGIYILPTDIKEMLNNEKYIKRTIGNK